MSMQKAKQKQKKNSHAPSFQKRNSSGDKKRKLTFGLVIGLLAFLLYSNTLSHDYVLDDFSAIKENNIVRQGIKAIPEIFKTSYRQGYLSVKDGLYRPLSLAMFAVEWNYFPDKPGISHFVNILLYVLTGFLLFFVLVKLFSHLPLSEAVPAGRQGEGRGEAVAFITSLLFIAHPLHVEVVANIKSRDEILCFLFVLFSFWFILKYIDEAKKKFIPYSMLFLFLAFLSKETAITYLALLPIALHFFRGISVKKNLLLLIPFLIITGIYLVIRSSVLQGAITDDAVSVADNIIAGTKSFSTHMGTVFYILGLYILKLIFPHPLSYDYSFNQIPTVEMTNVFSIASMLVYFAIGGYAVFILYQSFRRNRDTSNKYQAHLSDNWVLKYLSFGIFFFLITIFLFSNLILIIGTSMGDRLMYFPSLGFCLVIAILLVYLLRITNFDEFRIKDFFKPNFLPVIFIVTLYSFKTYSRNADWKDNYTLYSHDVTIVPNSVKAHYYLGLELVKVTAEVEPDMEKKKKMYEQGISELEKAVAILPTFSSAYTQLGVAYYRLKNFEKAIENYNKAASLSPSDAITTNNIGTIYFEWKKYSEAKEKFQQALAIDPRFVDAHMNLGSVCGQTGDFNNAIVSFQNATKYAPDNANAYYFMALTYSNMGDKTNADKYFQIAEKMNPNLKRQ